MVEGFHHIWGAVQEEKSIEIHLLLGGNPGIQNVWAEDIDRATHQEMGLWIYRFNPELHLVF